MKMPQAAKQQFDRLLTAPMKKTNAHKKEIEALQKAVVNNAEAAAVVSTVMALLNRVDRKTSPLYLRMIHAAAAYVGEGEMEAVDWGLSRQVVKTVAHSTKQFDLKR